MVDRYDLVLAVIPLVATSGLVLERLVAALRPAVALADPIAALPLALLGFVLTLGVIGHELVAFPAGE